jgi:hypothetical protein
MGREARLRAEIRAALPAPRMIFGLTKQQKRVSVRLSYCMAVVDTLKREEAETFGGKNSCLYVKLDNLEEHLGLVLDHYRVEKMHRADLDRASKVYDAMDALVSEAFK